ncbi:MAG: NAD(P)H-hydrate dehydratase [Thermoplasmataceae archaeon]
MMFYEDVARADRNYEYFVGDLWTLMQNAGSRVAEYISKSRGDGNKILVVAGNGNNGGDGIVAATLLSGKNSVSLFAISGPYGMKTRDSRHAMRDYRGRFMDIQSFMQDASGYDVIVDAIFGSGFSGEPRPPYDAIIRKINESGAYIVSVDVPSALGSSLPVKPAATVTYTDSKIGMTPENSGEIIIADIGIPEKVFTHNGPGEFVYFRKSEKLSHKGMNGRVAIIGGWTYHGSAVIASGGAMAVGSDLVKIYTTGLNYPVISSYDPGIIVRNLDLGVSREEVMNNDSILIGSGMGKGQDVDLVTGLVKGFTGTIVLDAEGLDFHGQIKKAAPGSRIIMTPHAGEFRRISGLEPTPENAEAFAASTGSCIILKGSVDTVTDGKKTRFTEGGNPRMTMGGTGDLLAGLATGLSARAKDPFLASCMASFLNKSAGDFCLWQKSLWYNVSDMIHAIPDLMIQYVG